MGVLSRSTGARSGKCLTRQTRKMQLSSRDNGLFVTKTFFYQDKSGKLTKEEWHNVLNESGCKTSM